MTDLISTIVGRRTTADARHCVEIVCFGWIARRRAGQRKKGRQRRAQIDQRIICKAKQCR